MEDPAIDASKPGETPPRPWSRWLTWVLLVGTLGTHISFLAADRRLPRDLGLFYRALPDAWKALDPVQPNPSALLGLVARDTGWYDVLIAAALRLFGRSGDVFQAFDVLWVGVALAASAWIARRLAGPTAGAIAVALAGAMPALVVAGRTAWLHVPEAALALLALVVWMSDAALSRRRTAWTLGLLGALNLALRPSGLVWTATLALLPLASAWGAWRRGEPVPWGRVGTVFALWGVGAAVPLRVLGEYLSSKMEARSRYATSLPMISDQLFSALGVAASLMALGGIVAGLLSALRRRPRASDPAHAPTAVVLLAWIVIPVVLWLIFQAGIDNFTLLGPAAAIVAAWGMTRVAPRLGLAIACFGWLQFTLPQHMAPPQPGSWLLRLPEGRLLMNGPTVMNYYRPYDAFGEAEIGALFDASCEADGAAGSCIIAVDQGFTYPFSEEPGELELFLLGDDRVRLLPLRDQRQLKVDHVDALAVYHCGDRDLQWRERYPRSLSMMIELKDHFKLEPAWLFEVAPRCSLMWFVPNGQARSPEKLPARGLAGPPPMGSPPVVPPPGSALPGPPPTGSVPSAGPPP